MKDTATCMLGCPLYLNMEHLRNLGTVIENPLLCITFNLGNQTTSIHTIPFKVKQLHHHYGSGERLNKGQVVIHCAL